MKTDWVRVFSFYIAIEENSSKRKKIELKGKFNPIPHEFWNNVSTWVWAIMAPPEFRLYKLVNSQLSTQKLFSDEYFDV